MEKKRHVAAETTESRNFGEEFRVLTSGSKVMKARHRTARVLECWSLVSESWSGGAVMVVTDGLLSDVLLRGRQDGMERKGC